MTILKAILTLDGPKRDTWVIFIINQFTLSKKSKWLQIAWEVLGKGENRWETIKNKMAPLKSTVTFIYLFIYFLGSFNQISILHFFFW